MMLSQESLSRITLSANTQNRTEAFALAPISRREKGQSPRRDIQSLSKSIPGVLECRQTFNYSNIWLFWDEATHVTILIHPYSDKSEN